MIEFPLHREITDYQDKVIGQLSVRGLLGIVIGSAVVIGAGVLMSRADIPSSLGSWVLVLLAPVFYIGLAKPDTGVSPERYLQQIAEHYLSDNSYVYHSESEYLIIASEREGGDSVGSKTAHREQKRKEYQSGK